MDTNVRSTIAARISVRAYAPEPLSADMLIDIQRAGDTSLPLDAGIALRFVLLRDGAAFSRDLGGAFRMYGRMHRAPHFLAAVSPMAPGYLENCGFRMEQLILQATALGVGTCWLGGLYSRQKVADVLGLRANEQVVALTPLGQPAHADTRTLAQRALKLMLGSHPARTPLAELAFAGRWGQPIAPALAGRPLAAEMLEAARLAPSWANSQPWRFMLREQDVLVAASRPKSQNELPYYLLDAGIAASHIVLVGRAAGLELEWESVQAQAAAWRSELGLPAEYDPIVHIHWDGKAA